MDDKRQKPGLLVALLAMLGIYSLPQVVKMQGSEPVVRTRDADITRSWHGLPEAEEPQERDRRDLRPLLEFLSEGEAKPSDTADLHEYLDRKLSQVRCLVVTVPDPVESVVSARFDEFLDVVQRGIELQEFVLDRTLLPWEPATKDRESALDRTSRIRWDRLGLDFQIDTTRLARQDRARPGLMVFKKALLPGSEPPSTPTVVLAFLVRESPILGVEKAELARSLDLIDQFFYHKLTGESEQVLNERGKPVVEKDQSPLLRKTCRHVLHIVGPCFSGSQTSIEFALGAWKNPDDRSYHFRFISGGANQVEKTRLENLFAANHRHRLTFHSMVHPVKLVMDEMLGYLEKSLGYEATRVAVLVESNSGLIQSLFRYRNTQPVEFIFPLQISELRKAYEREGLIAGGKLDDASAPERLKIPPDEAGRPRDLPRSFTPRTSAAFDEMELTQVLTSISHRRYNAVGIVATNPFDVVFLAREVRRFCPNLRLFTIQADLLLARPHEALDLRGMLVASTYSLHPSNQWISPSFGEGPRLFFSDFASQGLYNATVAHLWEMSEGTSPYGPGLVEYGLPYNLAPRRDFRPPIWVSAVGERGLYPVSPLAGSDLGYLYHVRDCPEGRRTMTWPLPGPDRIKAAGAMRPNPHLLFWLLCLFLLFACFASASVTYRYVRWSVDPPTQESRSQIWVLGLHHVLRHLNADIVTGGAAPSPAPSEGAYPTGAGPYLALINLLVLGLSYYVFSVFLVAMSPFMLFRYFMSWFWILLAILALAVVTGSLLLSVIEGFSRFLELVSRSCNRLLSRAADPANAEKDSGLVQNMMIWVNSRKQQFENLEQRCSATAHGSLELLKRRSGTIFGTTAAITFLVWSGLIKLLPTGTKVHLRLAFERITDLPSGLSPIFPMLFLSVALGAWIASQLARRRFYRLSYLEASAPDQKPVGVPTHFENLLPKMRGARESCARMIAKPLSAYRHVNVFLRCTVAILLLLPFIRLLTRGLPRSLEGHRLDMLFWSVFFVMLILIVLHTFQLLALWRETRVMLNLAVELPMPQAFDRIPARFTGWFFGQEDFDVRKQLILQQSTALVNRSTPELAAIFDKVFPKPDNTSWISSFAGLRTKLRDPEAAINSTREIYAFLRPFWNSLPVEDVTRLARENVDGKNMGAEWLASWPLTTKDYSPQGAKNRARQNPHSLTPQEHELVRDWARMAEDLIALQLVRWFAPALSQIVPVMNFLVLGSLSLLLSVTSYPFDHQGWLLTVVFGLVVFVAWAVVLVLIGINRNELISRVGDTTPGKLTFDSRFVGSLMTMIAPLLGALLAISFDVSDLLHTWLGPIFQLF